SGGEGGIRTHVGIAPQPAFEAGPLRPLRYLSGGAILSHTGGRPGGKVARRILRPDREVPMRILVAYDGSPSADLAVEEMARRPWPAGSAVRLIGVLEDATPVPAEVGIDVYGPVLEKLRLSQRQALEAGLRKAVTRFSGRTDLQADVVLREGAVVRTLLEAIR